LADRTNGGLLVDNWHHRRSRATDDDLLAVPPGRILSIQLSDGTADPVGPPVDDVVHRALPGDGALGVVPFVRALDERGVNCPVGVEVLRRDIVAGGPDAAAKTLFKSLRAVIDAARGDADRDG
jgi:sugar phosphate isomerase/epimerase